MASERKPVSGTAEQQTRSTKERRRAIVAGAVGNILEWYDFIVYAFVASTIGALYFPSDDPQASLLGSLAVFGVGFLARPLGGIMFGHLGDRAGRRSALSLSVLLMGASTLLIGVLPTHAQIGILAPVLLVTARLMQGVSAGGELIGSSAFLVEYAPQDRRGKVGSYQQVTLGLGFLLGALIVTLLSNVMSSESFGSWGWRVPFIIGAPIALIGLYLRRKVSETPAFNAVRQVGEVQKNPIGEAWRRHRKAMLVVIGFTAGPSVGYYVYLTYIGAFAQGVIGLDANDALIANVLGLASFVLVVPLMGRLSDKVGRRPVLMAHAVGTMALSYPLFAYMQAAQSFFSVLLAAVLGGTLMAMFGGPAIAAYVEMFPARVRYSGLSVPYNVTLAIFGGFAPFVATWLSGPVGAPLGGTLELIIFSLVALIIFVRMPETHQAPLK